MRTASNSPCLRSQLVTLRTPPPCWFGEESRSNHKQFLFRRIAWRIQALAEGGLSERARRRAFEIANDADLRIRAPKPGLVAALDPKLSVSRKVASALDPRLPPPGTYLEREYKGRRIIVKILLNDRMDSPSRRVYAASSCRNRPPDCAGDGAWYRCP
jgi:hypothetical protein